MTHISTPAHSRRRTARRAFTIAVSTAAVTVLVAACGSSTDSSDPMAGHPMSSAPSTATSAPRSPAASATPASGPHDDDDITFATMMIPHHQQAIEMSDVVLTKDGIDPEVADLATRIKAAQTPEITQMSGWLAGWGQNPSPSAMGGMDGMNHDMGDGMMSQADLDTLKDAPADQAGTLYLSGMIKHHEGAVTMARTQLDTGQNPEAEKLARTIISTQQAEITEMNQLLGN